MPYDINMRTVLGLVADREMLTILAHRYPHLIAALERQECYTSTGKLNQTATAKLLGITTSQLNILLGKIRKEFE